MSIIVCDNCGKIVDTDYHEVFWHNDGRIFCEYCAVDIFNFTSYEGVFG